MTRHWHPTLERIVRWLKPSAESFAAAAAVYSPELMLQLEATKRAVEGSLSPGCDGRSAVLRAADEPQHGGVELVDGGVELVGLVDGDGEGDADTWAVNDGRAPEA